MTINPKIFKAYDIRGIYPDELNGQIAYLVGLAFAKKTKAKQVVVGRDMRNSGGVLKKNLIQGLADGGVKEIVDIGLVPIDAVYASVGIFGYQAGIMITASHNPPEYNGLKISGKNALVISKKNGLKELEDKIKDDPGFFVPGGIEETLNITHEYLNKIKPYKEGIGKLKCIVDCSNGVASVLVHKMIENLPGDYQLINAKIDGNFPAHGPNPTIESNLAQIKKKVLLGKADLGICFDGDGDRTIFIDENGKWMMVDGNITMAGHPLMACGKKWTGAGKLWIKQSASTICH